MRRLFGAMPLLLLAAGCGVQSQGGRLNGTSALPPLPSIKSIAPAETSMPQGSRDAELLLKGPHPLLFVWSPLFSQPASLAVFRPNKNRWVSVYQTTLPSSWVTAVRWGPRQARHGQVVEVLTNDGYATMDSGVYYNFVYSNGDLRSLDQIAGNDVGFGPKGIEGIEQTNYRLVWSNEQWHSRSLGILSTIPDNAMRVPWSVVDGEFVEVSSTVTAKKGQPIAFVPTPTVLYHEDGILGPFSTQQAAQAVINNQAPYSARQMVSPGIVVYPPGGTAYWVIGQWFVIPPPGGLDGNFSFGSVVKTVVK